MFVLSFVYPVRLRDTIIINFVSVSILANKLENISGLGLILFMIEIALLIWLKFITLGPAPNSCAKCGSTTTPVTGKKYVWYSEL